MKDVNCPYCGAELDIDHEDGYGYEEDIVHDQQCSNCGKNFTYRTSIRCSYDVHKADCLNGGDHDWQPTHTAPECFKKMVCTQCDTERDPEPEEKIKYHIPPKEEYFDSLKK